MSFWYQHLPLNIDPIAFSIGSFSVRWYAISYIIGLAVIYGLLMLRIKKGEFPTRLQDSTISDQQEIQNKSCSLFAVHCLLVVDFLLVSFFAALIGGRIGYVLIYGLPYFISNPSAIISPFGQQGNFTGLYGMSYHGALLGIILGGYVFLHIKKIDFFEWADFVVPAVPLGYFFGRLGNFLNGELYGRATVSSIGMYFQADPFVLRHPSQLYEAVLEGLVLFLILWKMRNARFFPGALLGAYLIGYGAMRIVAEIFREPDPQLGLFFSHCTMGQILSLLMIVSGSIIILKAKGHSVV